jgi:hypothetical protein
VELPARSRALVEAARDERAIAIQPTLGLQKVEEEKTGRVEQRDAPRSLAVTARRKGCGEPIHLGLESPIKPACQRIAAEHLEAPAMKQHVRFGPHRCERAERFGIRGDHALGLPQQRGQTHAARVGHDGGYAGPSSRGIQRGDQPEHVRRARRQATRMPLHLVAERGGIELDEQDPHHSDAGGELQWAPGLETKRFAGASVYVGERRRQSGGANDVRESVDRSRR